MTQAPNSAGEASPRTIVPANACDAHCHILDPRFAPGVGTRPAGMTVADYRLLQQRIGTERSVFVQAKYHGTDHACLRDALAQMNGKARGVAVVPPEVTDADLRELHAAGVRGLRFSVWNPADTIATIEMIDLPADFSRLQLPVQDLERHVAISKRILHGLDHLRDIQFGKCAQTLRDRPYGCIKAPAGTCR